MAREMLLVTLKLKSLMKNCLDVISNVSLQKYCEEPNNWKLSDIIRHTTHLHVCLESSSFCPDSMIVQ